MHLIASQSHRQLYTEAYRVQVRGREMVMCNLCMAPDAQSTTRYFLAVNAGALEITMLVKAPLK